ncbi:hypothetical protein HK27_13575, partial [Acetobacter orientalis]
NLDRQSFTIEVIQNVQEPKSTSIHQPVRHKIHGPDPVGKGRNRQLFRLFANQTPAGFNPQVEGSKNRWLMRLARDFRFLAI